MQNNFKKIIFITSYPKSGNTWTRLIISRLLNHQKKFNLKNINDILLFSDFKNFEKLDGYKMLENKPIDFDFIVSNWVNAQYYINKNSDKDIYFKTHNVHGLVNNYYFTNKDVCKGFIHLVRDPRDVAISLSHHMNYSIDQAIDDMIYNKNKRAYSHKVFEVISTWKDNINSWLLFRDVPSLFIRYEDLLTNASLQIMRIINFHSKINSPLDNVNKEIISKIITETAFHNLQNCESKFGFSESKKTTKFFREGTSNQWKIYLNNKQVNKIQDELNEPMKFFNYL